MKKKKRDRLFCEMLFIIWLSDAFVSRRPSKSYVPLCFHAAFSSKYSSAFNSRVSGTIYIINNKSRLEFPFANYSPSILNEFENMIKWFFFWGGDEFCLVEEFPQNTPHLLLVRVISKTFRLDWVLFRQTCS